MNNDIIKKIECFIIEWGWTNTLSLNRETTIEKGLGITGDDSDEFLIAFGKAFNVDISQFPIGDYFEDEGDPILPAIIRLFTRKEKKEKKILTIAHLEKAILAGKLDEKIINN